MGFSRPEYGSGEPVPSPGHLSNPGIEPRSPSLWADSLPAGPQGKPKNTGIESGSAALQVSHLVEGSHKYCHHVFIFII